jgi:hypothetical protein
MEACNVLDLLFTEFAHLLIAVLARFHLEPALARLLSFCLSLLLQGERFLYTLGQVHIFFLNESDDYVAGQGFAFAFAGLFLAHSFEELLVDIVDPLFLETFFL